MKQSTSTESPKLVTLTCSGGISLGAYMGGVFYELVKESVKDNPKITIDIITGASAGAMSGAVAAYYLLGGGKDKLFSGKVEDDLFYQAWVEKADMKFIEELQPEEIQSTSLSVLSGEAINKIADVIKEAPPILATTKPLALLMTVTNLQGLLKDQGGTKVITNAETREFLFKNDIDENTIHNMWDKVKLSARISGAFPVAFPPIADTSNIKSPNFQNLSDEDYFEPNSKPKVFKKLENIYVDANKLKYLYTDGGILDNLPIRKAIDFETDFLQWIKEREANNHNTNKLSIDTSTTQAQTEQQFYPAFAKTQLQDLPERIYVYVVPAPVKNLKSSKRLMTGNFSMLEVGLSGLQLPKTEQDSIQINEINHRNKLATYKQQLIEELDKDCSGNIEQVKATLEKAIPYRKINLSPISPAIIGKIATNPNLTSLKPIFDRLPKDVQGFLQEGNAEALLASDFLGAFGGFFNKSYREHDFLLGRLCGITWLHLNCSGIQISESEIANLANEIEQKILAYDPQPSDLKFSQKTRLARMAIRALRIVAIEGKIAERDPQKLIASFWKIFFGILRILAIITLRTLEGLVTVLMKISELFGF